jgi:hypothetical protein
MLMSGECDICGDYGHVEEDCLKIEELLSTARGEQAALKEQLKEVEAEIDRLSERYRINNRRRWGSCFWCGNPATYIIGKDGVYACDEHGSAARENGWLIREHSPEGFYK